MKETERSGGNLKHKEWEALKQRVEQMEFQGQRRNERVKTLKKIQKVKAMLEQSKKMDESHQRMEQLQGVV